jgi:decaprenyl-phosphate phosphoribosyltransferase
VADTSTLPQDVAEAAPAAEAPAAIPPAVPGPFKLSKLPGGLIRNARPRQWLKNVLVVAAPGAAGMLGHAHVIKQTGIVFALFCAAASGIYFLNDALDVEADRAHPTKRNRPIAAGIVPLPIAFVAAAVLLAGATTGALLLCNPATASALGVYIVMQILYCTGLKHVLVVDLAFVTSGFLIRSMIGGLASDIKLSQWFLITTAFGSLFMVAAKRYSELVEMGDKAKESRKLLAQYTPSYLRFVWQAAATVAVLAYCLWALEPAGASHPALRQITIAPFVFAMLRYGVFADRGTAGAPEDVVLKDRPLMALGLLWVALYAVAVVGL